MKFTKALFDTTGKKIFMGFLSIGVVFAVMSPSPDEQQANRAAALAAAEKARLEVPFEQAWATEVSTIKKLDSPEMTACGSAILQRLRDPNSFQLVSARIVEHQKKKTVDMIISYRAKNGFGGYVPGSGTCTWRWDPAAKRFVE